MDATQSGSRGRPLGGLTNDAAHDVAGMGKIVDPATPLKAALLPRDVACKARKMRLEARHGKIRECADLRNGKPTLWGNEVQRHRGGLVLREDNLQQASRNLRRNM